MTGQTLAEILLLLGLAVLIVTVFQRLGIPSSLGYLLVGVLLGPYTVGPVIDSQHIRVAAELGIVFLLFTIGLNFSLPQIYALRHLVLGLGTGQVLLTTVIVGMAAWLAGLPPAAAFVVGAVFAQSSTTIISKQLAEQGEEQSQHGRLALAMSVFQDVTAVPFVVVIPVLATATAGSLVLPLSWALAKALLAFALVLFAGRWMLRPLFHEIAARRSAELFTLTVLLVSLMSAWATHSLGLSMAFGAFLAGMMLGPVGGFWVGALSALWLKVAGGMGGLPTDLLTLHIQPILLATITERFHNLNSLETLQRLVAPFTLGPNKLLLDVLQIIACGLAGAIVGWVRQMNWAEHRPWANLALALFLGSLTLWAAVFLLPIWVGAGTVMILFDDWYTTVGIFLCAVIALGLYSLRYLLTRVRKRPITAGASSLPLTAPGTPGKAPTTEPRKGGSPLATKSGDDPKDVIKLELD